MAGEWQKNVGQSSRHSLSDALRFGVRAGETQSITQRVMTRGPFKTALSIFSGRPDVQILQRDEHGVRGVSAGGVHTAAS